MLRFTYDAEIITLSEQSILSSGVYFKVFLIQLNSLSAILPYMNRLQRGFLRFILSLYDLYMIFRKYIYLLYGFEGSCILIGRRAVRKNPYSDRGP